MQIADIKKENNLKTIKWLFKIPGNKLKYIALLMLAQALLAVTGVIYAIFLRDIVDAAIEHDSACFWHSVVLTIILIFIQLLIKAVIRISNEYSKATFENLFKGRLFYQLLKKDYTRINALHSEEWQNRLTNDAVIVANGYVEIIPGMIGMTIKIIGAAIMVYLLDRRLALILIPTGLIFLILTYLFRKKIKIFHKSVQEADGSLRIFLQERINCLMMIHSFAVEFDSSNKAGLKMEEHKKARMKKINFSNLCNIVFGIVISGAYLFVICYCGYGIMMGVISFGTLTAITQLVTQIQIPLGNITGFLPQYYTMIASAERLMEVEEFDEETDFALPLSNIINFYHSQLDKIVLKNVSYVYYSTSDCLELISKSNMPFAVRNFDFTLKKGECVAFTGHSGCGKTTILKLLMCICSPETGERYAITKEGKKIALDDSYRRLFAYVPQGNQLMNGTIREVVCFSDQDDIKNEERFNNALRIACADEFVSNLEDGSQTVLGERGTGLSEGQMQRLSIARAVFSGSPILLLDEATSALDRETEKRTLQNLKNLADRTIVIISHRKEVTDICDRIIRFEEDGVKTV